MRVWICYTCKARMDGEPKYTLLGNIVCQTCRREANRRCQGAVVVFDEEPA